jgi:hypothetical protein
MSEPGVRSLNLSVSAAVGLFEARRQLLLWRLMKIERSPQVANSLEDKQFLSMISWI